MPHWTESIRAGILLLLAAVLVVGTGLGIVFGALAGSLLAVLLAATVPGSAAIWVLAAARRMPAPGDRRTDNEA